MNVVVLILNDIIKKNPFKEMNFIKFWFFSTFFFITFPVSLVFCFLYLGSLRTKQFIMVLINDFLQTIFIIFLIILVVVYFLIDYLIIYFN